MTRPRTVEARQDEQQKSCTGLSLPRFHIYSDVCIQTLLKFFLFIAKDSST